MSEKNKQAQPFIMVFSVTAVLILLSFLPTQWTLFGSSTKKISVVDDIRAFGLLKKSPKLQIALNDSLLRTDSVAYAKRLVDSSNIFDFENDSSSALAHFFQALNETKRKKRKTRIAYFGDSMIEGDLITQDLRSCMQTEFGGSGVGYMPITSVVAGFRTSIIHSFEGWTTYNLLENPPANHVLGISGYGFVPGITTSGDTTAKGSWVKYCGVKQQHLDRFNVAKLLYGKSAEGNFVQINGTRYALNGQNAVNELEIKGNIQALKANFQCSSPLDVFGFSLEADTGAVVDNFSFRGNSGLPIVKVPQSVYSGTDKCLEYDLIILEYGLNAVDPKVTDFSWYARGMRNVIKHMQASFPHASILLISVGDKAYRKDGTYQTDPSVPLMVQTQKALAEEFHLAFWSLYDAMGGEGAMVQWVEGDTVYANKDYTHFNFRGAHRVGKLLYSKLLGEYNDYNKQKNKLALAN